MLKRLALFALLSGLVFGQGSADVPPIFRNLIDDATYQQLRSDYINLLRGLPADPGLREIAIQLKKTQTLPVQGQQLQGGQQAPTPVWTPIGPSPIPNGQVTGSLAVSGRTTAIVIDPTNSNIVYLGTAQGGVYRSTDGGTNWAQIFDGALSSAIGALALAPSDHTILFVGTGESNGSADSYAGVGVYRIDSAPTTATLVGPINPVRNYLNGSGNPVSGQVFFGRSISSIIVHPTDPSIVWVGVAGGVIGAGGEAPGGNTVPPLGMRGLYRLTNATSAPASVTVQKVAVATVASGFDTPNTANRNVDALIMEPGNPDRLIVWINGNNVAGDGGIYLSTNATAATPTFTQTFTTPLSGARGRFAGYKEASNAMVIYVADGENSAGRLRVSSDGGATWSGVLAGGQGFCGGQCFYNIGLDVLPGATTALNDDIVVLGGNVASASTTRLFAKSVNGGATFTESSAGLHADTHFVTIDPNNPNTVYHGDDGGVFKSIDGGTTWASLNNSQINSVQFSGLAVHPVDPKWAIGGTQDNGTNMRDASGNWNRVDFGDGGYALVDRNATNTTNGGMTMYHTYFNQTNNLLAVARVLSTACALDGNWTVKGVGSGSAVNCDGTSGANGIVASDAVLFYAPLELGPGNPSTLYYGAGAVYRSINKGDTMTAVSQKTTAAVSTIGVSPQDDNYRAFGRTDGTVFYTTTGANPMTALAGIPTGKFVGRVKFDPSNKNTLYVAIGGYFGGTSTAQSHVWKVTNLDTTPVVTGINSGLPDAPVNAFAVDPANSSRLFAGTDVGVWASTDGGASWLPFGTGLPIVAIFGMEIQPQSQTLRVGTHGRGMWEIGIAVTAVNVTSQFSITQGSPVLNRATGKYAQTVTVTNNGAAVSSAAYVLDNLVAGWTLNPSDGTTSATSPSGSPYHLIGVLGAGSSATFQLTFTRVGAPAFGYAPRILEGAPR